MASAAYYNSLAHNLVGENLEDTVFDPETGLLSINDSTTGLTHNTDPAIAVPQGGVGVQGYATVSLSTTLVGFDTPAHPGKAVFAGGNFSLSFLFDPEGDGSYESYSIGGPIEGLVVECQPVNSSLTKFYGEGLWQAVTKSLPADWLDGGGYSSINTLTIDVGSDFTAGFDWTTGFAGQSLYSLFPNDEAVPEPGTLLLLAGGALFLRRRRVA
ncbi:MAG: PEP-CTERM sorting domain-containing protein [Phycisphaerae bacterium]|nr:PEP-CTERM sorting domain-containing protein [Phycisphaerae bacterium]